MALLDEIFAGPSVSIPELEEFLRRAQAGTPMPPLDALVPPRVTPGEPAQGLAAAPAPMPSLGELLRGMAATATPSGVGAPLDRLASPSGLPTVGEMLASGGVEGTRAAAPLDRLSAAPSRLPTAEEMLPGSATLSRGGPSPGADSLTGGRLAPAEAQRPPVSALVAGMRDMAARPGPESVGEFTTTTTPAAQVSAGKMPAGPDADAIVRGAQAAADARSRAPAASGGGDFADRLRGFFAALQGQDPRRFETENMTVRALTARGMDPNMATIVARNPALLQSALATMMGPRNPTVIPEGASVRLPDGQIITPGGAGGRQARAFEQAIGKQQAERLGTINAAAQNARDQLASLEAMEQALNEYNTQSTLGTGNLAPYEAAVRRFAQHFGIAGAETAAAAELITSIQNRMALLMRNPDGGMGMPGALSDADREFLRSAQPGIDKSPAGNRLMIGIMRRMEQRKIEIAQLAESYIATHGNLTGFEAAVRQYANANPLFADMRGPGRAGSGDGFTIRRLN
jgi:hypothetical protein